MSPSSRYVLRAACVHQHHLQPLNPLSCVPPQEKSIQLDMVMNKAKKEVTEWGEDMGVKVRRLHNFPSKASATDEKNSPVMTRGVVCMVDTNRPR